MDAKAYLKQVKKLDKIIMNKQLEVDQWRLMAIGTTAQLNGDRVQASSSQQKMADAVTNYVYLNNSILDEIKKLNEIKLEIIRTIEKLPITEYDLLHKIYIQYKSFDEVASEYKKSKSWAFTVHGIALKHLNEILREREKKDECKAIQDGADEGSGKSE